jgi:hypothetical protein
LFFVGYGIWLISALFYVTLFAPGVPLKSIRVVCYAIFLASEASRGDYPKFYVLRAAIMVAAITILINSTGGLMIDAVVIIFCAQGRSFRTIAKETVTLSIVVLVITITASFVGILPGYSLQDDMRNREFLGFRYPLYPSQILFNVTLLVLYLKRPKIQPILLVALSIANLAMFQLTGSRLSFILSITAILLVGLNPYLARWNWLHSFAARIMSMSFVLAAIIMVFLTVNYDPSNSFIRKLDDTSLLAGRFRLGHNALVNYGVPLYGQKLELFGNGLDIYGNKSYLNSLYYNYIDSLYIRLLVNFGIVIFVAFITVFTIIAIRAYARRDITLLVLLAIIACHCTIDDLSMNLYYNTFFLLLTCCWDEMTQSSTHRKRAARPPRYPVFRGPDVSKGLCR